MSQVLQRQMDQELELVEGKGGGAVLGKVSRGVIPVVFRG